MKSAETWNRHEDPRDPRNTDPRSQSNNSQHKTTNSNSVSATKKIENFFDFIHKVWDMLALTIVRISLLIWHILTSIVLGATSLIMAMVKSFDVRLLISFWVLVALLVCTATLFGWYYMGWSVAPNLETMFNIDIKRNDMGIISTIIGLALNFQQVQGSLWQIKKSVAKAWHEAGEGKNNLATAATKPKSYLVAKMKRDTYFGWFLEMAIQCVYHGIMRNNIITSLGAMLIMLILPEKLIVKAAHQLQFIENNLV